MAFQSSRQPPQKIGLQKLVGNAKLLADPPDSGPPANSPGEKFWSVGGPSVGYGGSATPRRPYLGKSPLAQSVEAQFDGKQMKQFSSDAGALLTSRNPARTGATKLLQWVERELQLQGTHGHVMLQDRVRILNEAFCQCMEMLPDYRPLFVSVLRENEALNSCLQEQLRDMANVEGRMKTIKMESLSFVGESTVKYQEEIKTISAKLSACENHRDKLLEEKKGMQEQWLELQQKSERDRWLAAESHAQNLDILNNLDRHEKQVEALRVQEREMHAEIIKSQQQSKDKDKRISAVEESLNAERDNSANMVPREEYDTLKDELNAAKLKIQELEDKYANKQKDYLNIVDTYSRSIGQTLGEEVRPLTPRPVWHHCKGIIDPENLRSMEKAEHVQELLVKIVGSARTLLAAYGLATAAQKSNIVQKFAKHPQTLALAAESKSQGQGESRPKEAQGGPDEPANVEMQRRGSFTAGGLSASVERGSEKPGEAADKLDESKWLAPDTDPNTPEPLRHSEKCRNCGFSRKRTADFLQSVMKNRFEDGDDSLKRPFLEDMMEQVGQLDPGSSVSGEEDTQLPVFAINIFASVRRHAAEPDFLGYMLLVMGRVSDSVVRDNRNLCSEILRIFGTHFETSDGMTRITKQKFFYGLHEVLPHKEKEHCQDLVTYFPPGGPNVLINYEWLLQDDLYVISPIVFALRLQHLEESLSLCDRIEKAFRGCVKEGATAVKFEHVEAACKEDAQLALLQPEDFARAFQIPIDDLDAGTEGEAGKLIELMKHGGIFRELFFPALPDDDGEEGDEDVVPDETADMQAT